VLIVEDHALLTEVLALAMRLQGFEEVHTAPPDDTSPETVLALAAEVRPEVVLLDLHLGGRLGIPMIGPLIDGGARVLILTGSQDRDLLAECLEAGAAGLFDKSQPFDNLMSIISDAAIGLTVLKPSAREELLAELRGRRRDERDRQALFESLSRREREVLMALVDGRSAEDIAASLGVSVATVRTHIQSVLRKLGVNSQLAAVALARRSGWVTDEV
jgi:two-component system, NarL family, nitrate/nitrite response regulator NarL